MSPLIVAPVLELGKGLLDRFFPDPEKRAQAERDFILMLQDKDFKQILAQLEVNAKEAQHPSIWVAGWRPFFGWAGGVGFIYATILQPLLAWFSAIKGWPTPPVLNIDLLWVIITGMLGIGGYRTFEKVRGATK